MLKQEEIRFNEAIKDFEEKRAKVEEAINFYDTNWYGDTRERAGLTSENYNKLLEVQMELKVGLPQRGTIVDVQASSANLIESNRRENFLLVFRKSIQKILERIIRRNRENDKANEVAQTGDTINAEEIVAGETDLETNQWIEFEQFDDQTFFDVDKIIEDCRKAYEMLLTRSSELDVIYEKKIDHSPKGRVLDKKRDGPGILDDYRQSSWGIERICLDGFQNHLPSDSKGTKSYLHFKVGNNWVDCETAKLNRDKITEVRFSDNGVGFTPDNLFYLHSTKTSEDSSAGQFGEGMKLASIAAVNLGLGLEFQSRNWRAFATSEEKNIINTRNSDTEETRKKLVYDVTVYDGEPIVGSRTIFHTPTPEFIDYALQLPEKVMYLSEIKPKFSYNDVEIIDFEHGGDAFVKGIYLKNIESFFSYNFNKANVNPDRNGFHEYDESYHIQQAIANLTDIDMIEKFLVKILGYSKEKDLGNTEFDYWSIHPIEFKAANAIERAITDFFGNKIGSTADVWKDAFYRIFEKENILDKDGNPKQPVLKTDYKIPDYLQSTLEDYILISLPKPWISTLKKAGVLTDKDIIPEYIEEKVATSLSLDYGNQIWDAKRIVLDACQNHLPSDSKGTTIFLRFQTIDGAWHDYREFDKYDDSEITKIKISDDGVGYDSKNLGLFASVKDHSDSSGKWGEGLKMLSAAALRYGVQMELRSRDWIATPETMTELLNEGQVNEKSIERLVYNIKKRVDPESNILDDGDNAISSDYGFTKKQEVSSTTFVNPTPELIQEFRNIRESVLLFSPRTPIASVEGSDILATSGGQLFVRNILIPGNHKLKYTYHLKDFDIETRDRDVIKSESMKKRIRAILENVDDERFISDFLSDAVGYAQGVRFEQYEEFETGFDIHSETELADKWIKVFKHKFGEKTSIRAIRDRDFDAFHQAQHLGIDMITLPDALALTLKNLRGRDGQTIASYETSLMAAISNAVPVNEEDLTDYEKKMVEHLYNYNKVLGLGLQGMEPIKKIKIYDYPSDYFGQRAAGFAGLGNEINISRTTLNNGLIEAGHVFFHESDHAVTGAKDAEPEFRDYLSRLLSCVASRLLPFEESIQDNGVATDISINDINMALDSLKTILSKGKNQEDKLNDGEEFGEQ